MSTRQPVDNSPTWGVPTRQVVDIFRCPLDNFDKLTERAKTRNRQTQVAAGDPPFQVVRAEDSWSLVKLVDGTFGWLLAKQIKPVSKRDYWKNVKRAKAGKTLPSPTPSNAKIRVELNKFGGIPYCWGGTTEHGMDCSAFVQKLFWRLAKILLPRNSREQKKCGRSVYQKDICPLDILFFVHSTTGRHHVGVYFEKKIWHFCLDKKGLSIESLEEMKKRYRYLTTRKIIKLKKC